MTNFDSIDMLKKMYLIKIKRASIKDQLCVLRNDNVCRYVIFLSEVHVTLELCHTLQTGVLNFPSLYRIVNMYHCQFY